MRREAERSAKMLLDGFFADDDDEEEEELGELAGAMLRALGFPAPAPGEGGGLGDDESEIEWVKRQLAANMVDALEDLFRSGNSSSTGA